MSEAKADCSRLTRQEMDFLIAEREKRKGLAHVIKGYIDWISGMGGLDINAIKAEPTLHTVAGQMEEHSKKCISQLEEIYKRIGQGNETMDCSKQMEEAQVILRSFEKLTDAVTALLSNMKKDVDSYRTVQSGQPAPLESRNLRGQAISSQADLENMIKAFREELRDYISLQEMTEVQRRSIETIDRDLEQLPGSNLQMWMKIKKVRDLYKDYQRNCELIKDENEQLSVLYDEFVLESFDSGTEIPPIEDFSFPSEISFALETLRTTAQNRLFEEYISRYPLI